jgi:hypothetical protein
MLRVPQHERKNINDINSPPFVLSAVEGLLGFFSNLLETLACEEVDRNSGRPDTAVLSCGALSQGCLLRR